MQGIVADSFERSDKPPFCKGRFGGNVDMTPSGYGICCNYRCKKRLHIKQKAPHHKMQGIVADSVSRVLF